MAWAEDAGVHGCGQASLKNFSLESVMFGKDEARPAQNQSAPALRGGRDVAMLAQIKMRMKTSLKRRRLFLKGYLILIAHVTLARVGFPTWHF